MEPWFQCGQLSALRRRETFRGCSCKILIGHLICLLLNKWDRLCNLPVKILLQQSCGESYRDPLVNLASVSTKKPDALPETYNMAIIAMKEKSCVA